LIVASGELGHWLGQRTADHAGEDVATLKTSILGLLALMIGFTFAMAQTRFDLRCDAVLTNLVPNYFLVQNSATNSCGFDS
jgi:hypothetical protein